MAGDLWEVFGAAHGGLEASADAWASKIALKSGRLQPIWNGSDNDARGGNVGTTVWLAAMFGASLMVLGMRLRAQRRRASIRGMLAGSRPCAVRRS